MIRFVVTVVCHSSLTTAAQGATCTPTALPAGQDGNDRRTAAEFARSLEQRKRTKWGDRLVLLVGLAKGVQQEYLAVTAATWISRNWAPGPSGAPPVHGRKALRKSASSKSFFRVRTCELPVINVPNTLILLGLLLSAVRTECVPGADLVRMCGHFRAQVRTEAAFRKGISMRSPDIAHNLTGIVTTRSTSRLSALTAIRTLTPAKRTARRLLILYLAYHRATDRRWETAAKAIPPGNPRRRPHHGQSRDHVMVHPVL